MSSSNVDVVYRVSYLKVNAPIKSCASHPSQSLVGLNEVIEIL